MSTTKPILILQMQRMGDLVLSYPLMGWLGSVYPDNPLWVVGEEEFFSSLMPLSPIATYFPYSAAEKLKQNSYFMVFNLSHRKDAAALAGSLNCDRLIGPYQDSDGSLFINGDWQLYRSSLVQNNRHNLYHWADLNALDVIPRLSMLRTAWPARKNNTAKKSGGRVGLFVGASEAEKRPDAPFWAELAKKLLDYGHKPVFLGGKDEVPIGTAASAALKSPAMNMCGRFSIRALAEFITELDLFISPDTGPMHIATWVGTPVLNLSLGPVNAWETGPFAPGHHILKPTICCVGCWHCTANLACKKALQPGRVAFIAQQILAGKEDSFAGLKLVGQELLRSGRDRYGLFTLNSLENSGSNLENLSDANQEGKVARIPPRITRQRLSRFWQAFFGMHFGRMPAEEFTAKLEALRASQPALTEQLSRYSRILMLRLLKIKKYSTWQELHSKIFWEEVPPLLRPIGGYLQLYLQNAGNDSADINRAMSVSLEMLGSLE